MTFLRRAATIVGASLATSLAVAMPAYADTTTFADRTGEHGNRADITSVKVANGSGGGHRVAVLASVRSLEVRDYFTFWLDTRSSNAGPEYKVVVYPNSDGIGLQRVGSFGDGGTTVTCDGLRARADAFGPNEVAISVPRSCLGNPGKVRVAVHGRFVRGGTTYRDWAPKYRIFFGWVAR